MLGPQSLEPGEVYDTRFMIRDANFQEHMTLLQPFLLEAVSTRCSKGERSRVQDDFKNNRELPRVWGLGFRL